MFDTFEGATADREGSLAIVPGNVDKSQLWQRINNTDPDEMMPPPASQKRPLSAVQRDRLPMWFAGGGFKPGQVYGRTDEFGFGAVENPVHVHDIHATILHQLGIDHKRLSVRSQGLDFRLTGVDPARVVTDLLA